MVESRSSVRNAVTTPVLLNEAKQGPSIVANYTLRWLSSFQTSGIDASHPIPGLLDGRHS